MRAGPLVVVKRKWENLASKQACDINSFGYKARHNSLEKVAADEVVLVLANVAYDVADGSNLVVF